MTHIRTLLAVVFLLGGCSEVWGQTPAIDDPYAAVCRTPTCGGPDTPPIAPPEPIYPPVTDVLGSGASAEEIVMIGGVDPDGNARPLAVDRQGHLICTPPHSRRKQRYAVNNFPTSLKYLGTDLQIDRLGRAVCTVVRP
jgi:hypothetical protein